MGNCLLPIHITNCTYITSLCSHRFKLSAKGVFRLALIANLIKPRWTDLIKLF